MLEVCRDPSLVFVVEDQAILRLEAVQLLREAGYDTIEAATGDVALDVMRARWREVRVLFTDVQMPGKFIPKPYGGSTLISQVRRMIERGHTP